MADTVILGFAGSLRRGSYNRSLLRASAGLVPAGARVDVFDVDGFPLYNDDLWPSPGARVIEFKNRVKAADAILIATPEYNYSIPGVLKNAMDWASRPYGDNAFAGKPVAMMSASIGMLGGARAQYHLRQSFVFLDMYPVNHPEVFVTLAAQKFDEKGNLKDERAKELIGELLTSLVAWAKRLKGAG